MFEERNIKSFYSAIKEGHRSRTELFGVLGRYRTLGLDHDVKATALSRLH